MGRFFDLLYRIRLQDGATSHKLVPKLNANLMDIDLRLAQLEQQVGSLADLKQGTEARRDIDGTVSGLRDETEARISGDANLQSQVTGISGRLTNNEVLDAAQQGRLAALEARSDDFAASAGFRDFKTTAALLADTVLTYTAGLSDSVAANDMLKTRSEGFSYIVAPGAAADHQVTTAGGIKLYVATQDLLKPLARGAAGDGATNDKTALDAVNSATATVDLAGRDYAYTGDFAPAARFMNGRVISSTLGEFDYRTQAITGARTITVGATGTIKTLRAALDWLKSGIRIDGSLTLTLSGSHSLANYTFDHPNSDKLSIVGTALAGAMPTFADMTGTKATDQALIQSRFTAEIDIGGSGDNTTGGWRVPFGLDQIANVCILSNTRYSFDVGYSKSHLSSASNRTLQLGNVAVVGGVWGIIAVGTQLRTQTGTTLFMAYQNTGTQPGGPFDAIGGHWRMEGSVRVYSSGQASKYGLHAEAGARVIANDYQIKGPFLHGIHVAEGAFVTCNGLVTDGVSQPLTAQPGSQITTSGWSFSNGDVANTGTLTGAGQNGFGNNNTASAAIFAGMGASISSYGGTMSNMVCTNFIQCIGGQVCLGTTAITIDNCKSTSATIRLYASRGNYIAANVTNAQAGSFNQAVANAQSSCMIGTNSGFTFSPAVGTTTNGNLFTTAA